MAVDYAEMDTDLDESVDSDGAAESLAALTLEDEGGMGVEQIFKQQGRNKFTIDDIERDVHRGLALLEHDEWIGIDTETSGLSPWKDKIAVYSLFGDTSRTPVVLHTRGTLPEELRRFLSHPRRKFIGHNITCFDLPFLSNAGVDVFAGTWYDTLIGEQVALTTGRRSVKANLKDTIKRRLGRSIAKGLGDSSWMSPVLSDAQWLYCAEDIVYLDRLRAAQLKKIGDTRQADALELELRLAPIVVKMVMHGLPFDEDMLETYKQEQVEKEAQAHELLDAKLGTINVNSSKQVKEAINEAFGINLESTQFPILNELAGYDTELGHTMAALIVARKARKRQQMFSDEWVDKYIYEGWMHSRYRQVGTDTGRFSSSEPNAQQIPKDGRKLFGGLHGYDMVSCDYKALEVVVAAALAHDHKLIADLETGDVHKAVAARINDIPVDQVTQKQRRDAKAAVFTLLFAGSVKGLVRAAKLGGHDLSMEEALNINNAFFTLYPQIAATKNRAFAASRMKSLPINLPTGIRRVLYPSGKYNSISPSQIINTMVQGSAAAGLKHAMLMVDERGMGEYLGATVHDELVCIVPKVETREFAVEFERAMVDGMREVIDGPVQAEVTVGDHWK